MTITKKDIHPYTHSPIKATREHRQTRIAYIDPLPSKTDQSFRNEVNVNSIMAKYAKTGIVTHKARTAGVYADVSGIKGLQDAINQVAEASYAFSTLPAALREELGNDPSRLPEFLANPANNEKAYEYGLIEKAPVKPEPIKSTPVETPVPTPTPSK